MAGYTDRKHPFQTEVPFLFRIQERKDETTTGGIYMDRNVITGLGIVSIQSFIQCFDIIIQSSPCNTLNRYDTDGVFITHFQSFFGVKSGFFKRQRHFTHFNLPQLCKLFPNNLETCRNNKVWFIKWFALCLSFFTPTQPGSYTTQHTCF